MSAAFEDAEVDGYEPLIPAMTNDPDDRHVLAAVHAGAHAIATENVKHFPAESLSPHGIELMTADDFLVNQFHLDTNSVIAKLEAQTKKTRLTMPGLLQLLGKQGTPRFAPLSSESAALLIIVAAEGGGCTHKTISLTFFSVTLVP